MKQTQTIKALGIFALVFSFFWFTQPLRADHDLNSTICYTTEQARVAFAGIPGTAIEEPDESFQAFFLTEMKRRFPNWVIESHQFDNTLIAYVTDGVPFRTPTGLVEVIVYYYKDKCLLTEYIGRISSQTLEQVRTLYARGNI